MTLNSGTNVRLDRELKDRLQRVADLSGIKVAQLIRMAIEEYCEKIEKTGQVTISIPSIDGIVSEDVSHTKKTLKYKGRNKAA